jgi:hypothetical protein
MQQWFMVCGKRDFAEKWYGKDSFQQLQVGIDQPPVE